MLECWNAGIAMASNRVNCFVPNSGLVNPELLRNNTGGKKWGHPNDQIWPFAACRAKGNTRE